MTPEGFVIIVNRFIFAKRSILDVYQGSEYVSVDLFNISIYL